MLRRLIVVSAAALSCASPAGRDGSGEDGILDAGEGDSSSAGSSEGDGSGESTGGDIPSDTPPDTGDCLAELDALGLSWEPAAHSPEHPEGHPELTCEIEDPVYLYPPVGSVGFHYAGGAGDDPVFVACATARAIARTAEVLEAMGAVEFEHLGTYNCRVISGSDELSTHGLGLAIDLSGFALADATTYTVYDHFEDGVDVPVTPGGEWLVELADTLFAEGIWNIILTPNYNAAHDDHFHVDLTPGAHFYE